MTVIRWGGHQAYGPSTIGWNIYPFKVSTLVLLPPIEHFVDLTLLLARSVTVRARSC